MNIFVAIHHLSFSHWHELFSQNQIKAMFDVSMNE